MEFLEVAYIQRRRAVTRTSRLFVLRAGLEPARPQWSQDFKSCVSTNSTTRANHKLIHLVSLFGQKKPRKSLRVLSGKRDSNSRPRPWQGRALPTELFPLYLCNTFLVSFTFAKIRLFSILTKSFLLFLHNFFYLVEFKECFDWCKSIYINI